MENYLEQSKDLSVTAKVVISLIAFENYCEAKSLSCPLVNEFIAYIWQWPQIDGPDQFEPWEQSRTELVNYGLGDDAPNPLITALNNTDIDPVKFRELVSSIVEMLWGNFWGAIEEENTFNSYKTALQVSGIENLPLLTPFKFSLFSENSGWGNKINNQDLEFWRGFSKIV